MVAVRNAELSMDAHSARACEDLQIPLADLPVGTIGQVVGLAGDDADPVSRRLADLGFLAGTPVQALRRAPMGDPTVYRLRNYQMCLREREASRILVQIAGTDRVLP